MNFLMSFYNVRRLIALSSINNEISNSYVVQECNNTGEFILIEHDTMA